MSLYETPANKLDTFISSSLQPNKTFKTQINSAIKIIFDVLTPNCFKGAGSPMRVLKVVKAGSSGKGTAVKNISDVDLVVFVSLVTSFQDLKDKRKEIIAEIKARLEECGSSLGKNIKLEIKKTKREDPYVLTFYLSSTATSERIEFDVLPAFDVLGQLGKDYTRPKSAVYHQLIESKPKGNEFSSCFTELQRNFVEGLPTKLKNLIRLVKYWYKEYVSPLKEELEKEESLPPKYALELLSIYAWEKGSRSEGFDMAEGFRTVLELIRQHAQLCVYWTVNYDFKDRILGSYLQSQCLKARPVILDPADPTRNVGQGARWDLVAEEAQRCCDELYSKAASGRLVQPWDVPPQQAVTPGITPERFLAPPRWATDEEYPITEKRLFAPDAAWSYCAVL